MKKSNYKHIHFVGIKGVAMTSLALYVKDLGVTVTGSDVAEVFPTEEVLQQSHIPITIGFSDRTIQKFPDLDLVIYTGAHNGRENVEVIEAQKRNIAVLSHGQALGTFMDGHTQISIAGSHGKTTVSAMLATIFTKAAKQPSYCVGCGEILGPGAPGHAGSGDVFIAEADEYMTDPGHDPTPRFLWQHPELLVVTNIDYDHPDAFANLEAVEDAFQKLQDQLQGKKITVVNLDDKPSRILQRNEKEIVTYGFAKDADYQITRAAFEEGQTFFTLSVRKTIMGDFVLRVPGRHNISNAAAAVAAAHIYGLPYKQIKYGLAAFGGTKRRLQLISKTDAWSVYDDYAHHPNEITASLDALRSWYPKRRIITIFQPHTYSRTKKLLHEFARVFGKSDIVLIVDIYASARESDTMGITSADLVEAISKNHPKVQYIKNLKGAENYIRLHLEPGDIIICMGAGDIYTWGYEICEFLKKLHG